MQLIAVALTISFSTAVGIDSVDVVNVTALSGDIDVRITASDQVVVNSEGHLSVDLDDGVLEVSGRSYGITMDVPGGINLKLKAISGDITVQFDTTQTDYPDYIDIKSLSGDVTIYNMPPSRLNVNALNGDVEIYGYAIKDSAVWDGVSDTITVYEGDVSMDICVPAEFYIKALSGDVEISDADEMCSVLGNYTVQVAGGDVYIDSSVAEKFAQLVVEGGGEGYEPSESEGEEEEEAEKTSNFLELWAPSPGISGYNRVQGFILGISANLDNTHEYMGFKTRDMLSLGARYAFSLKRWDLWLGLQKSLFSPFFIGGKVHSMVATPDIWKLSDLENSAQAFLFNYDAFDYYLSKSFLGGAGVNIYPKMELFVGYEIEQMSSLSKRTNWSLFYPHTPFRANPAVDKEGEYRWIRGHLSAAVGPLKLDAKLKKAIDSPYGSDLMNILAQLKGKTGNDRNELRARLTVGYSSTEDFPFGFRLGGMGTLPGYALNSIETDMFGLLQVEYRAKFSGIDGIVFADAAKTGREFADTYIDMGLGVGTGPVSLLVARSIEKEAPFRLVFRLTDRI